MVKQGINVLGIGKALPTKVVLSTDIDKRNHLSLGTTEKVTGLAKRCFLAEDQTAESLLDQAIREALAEANLQVDDIDCIINASAIDQQAIPFNAASTHRLLNPSKPIAGFDINMTCLSVLRAFDIASRLLDDYKHILIVSCDIVSAGLDWSNIRTAGIFADGATAMVVTSSQTGGIILSNFEVHSEGYEYCRIRGAGHKITPHNYTGNYQDVLYFEMNGKKLYKLSSTILPRFIEESLASKNLTLDDIDWIVPHQASQSSLDHVVKLLNIKRDKFIDIFKTHGNQVASSIPSALHTLFRTQQLKSGQKIMLVGTSAGVGLGLVVWQVP
ncbi:3-oxoacyl-ACP synthase [Gallibacterium genomosp. 3]|uniref:3-oxoacyl-ACP synthase n=1 Tax=Gallibacterium genomosp. 3 TaxID=505345 RepID=A0A1A7NSR5_9PAST|nr:3-oxoacyl-[acyl-carrier-protein] synthase III C-terminal domain-containing protein [Gallibacterium genomosp. 3]OBW92551.1 3-oxoacyl-ACP synthase [Gallibacterium genomosp. 3]